MTRRAHLGRCRQIHVVAPPEQAAVLPRRPPQLHRRIREKEEVGGSPAQRRSLLPPARGGCHRHLPVEAAVAAKSAAAAPRHPILSCLATRSAPGGHCRRQWSRCASHCGEGALVDGGMEEDGRGWRCGGGWRKGGDAGEGGTDGWGEGGVGGEGEGGAVCWEREGEGERMRVG